MEDVGLYRGVGGRDVKHDVLCPVSFGRRERFVVGGLAREAICHRDAPPYGAAPKERPVR